MKIDISEIAKQVEASSNKNIWSFGNTILYDMCKNNPLHKETDIIVGKVWLIGRTYSVAVERRKKYNDEKNFYDKHIVPAIKEIADKLDSTILKLLKVTEITNEIVPEILCLHNLLCDSLFQITNLNKRSFASKYLHFHLPKLFYIYDSQVIKNIGKYNAPKDVFANYRLIGGEFDLEYAEFYLKANWLRNTIKDKFDTDLTPREIDNILFGTIDEI